MAKSLPETLATRRAVSTLADGRIGQFLCPEDGFDNGVNRFDADRSLSGL